MASRTTLVISLLTCPFSKICSAATGQPRKYYPALHHSNSSIQMLTVKVPSMPGILPTRTFENRTSTTYPSPPPTVCCFAVQDTVSEVWWQITSYSSSTIAVNLTSITTLITKYTNATSMNYDTNVYSTGITTTWTYAVGHNPISNEENAGPMPAETDYILNGTAPITTGEVVV